MRFIYLALLVLGLNTSIHGASFELGAQVSKDHVELGEAFTLSLVLTVDGNFSFAPQIEIPKMDGFQIQGGPQQSQNYSWINSVVKTQATVSWELVALKSGRLSLGPFKASAKDASQGEVVKTAPAISITVAKGQGFALPPTPTPEPDGALAPQGAPDELRDIKPDLGLPWARIAIVAGAAVLALALILWWALRPKPVKKVEAIRDPGQVALLELEKARQLLIAGDEEGYYKELGRIIRFYLRHRMRMPEKELTLSEAGRLLEQALMKSGDAGTLEASAAMNRLQELLFADEAPQAMDAEMLAPALRKSILTLEKDAAWSELDLVKAELDRAFELHGEGDPGAWYKAMLKTYATWHERQAERFGAEELERRLEAALEELGPAASARISFLRLKKRLREELDLARLGNDFQKLSELTEKGVNHGKRK